MDHWFFELNTDVSQINRRFIESDILRRRSRCFFKILTPKKEEPNLTSEAIGSFEGKLKVISPRSHGFLEDVFIDPKLIQNHNLSDGQTLKGRAILSHNKKKIEWRWKAMEIE